MAITLYQTDADFEQRFAAFLTTEGTLGNYLRLRLLREADGLLEHFLQPPARSFVTEKLLRALHLAIEPFVRREGEMDAEHWRRGRNGWY